MTSTFDHGIFTHAQRSFRDRERMRNRETPREQTLDSGEDHRELDAKVATHLMGYRWVEWNHPRLGGAPIDEPGSFLAAPDDPLTHLYMSAGSATSPRCDAIARVPRFSAALDHAFAAADAGWPVHRWGCGAIALGRSVAPRNPRECAAY